MQDHKIGFEKHSNLKMMSTEDLKKLLNKLEDQHDILEATNQHLTNQVAILLSQISDLRNAVKCVENERK